MKASKKYSDKEVIETIREGKSIDGPVYYLYQTHSASLANFIRKNNGSQSDAEDTVQEVMMVFIDLVRQEKFRGESSIKTFLYSITRNVWLNELKKRNRSLLRDTEYYKGVSGQEDEITTYIARNEASKQVLQVMDKLGETCKQILVAYYYNELSMKEILQQLHYENEQVLRNKKYKCMKSLMEMLDGNDALKFSLKNSLTYGS